MVENGKAPAATGAQVAELSESIKDGKNGVKSSREKIEQEQAAIKVRDEARDLDRFLARIDWDIATAMGLRDAAVTAGNRAGVTMTALGFRALLKRRHDEMGEYFGGFSAQERFQHVMTEIADSYR